MYEYDDNKLAQAILSMVGKTYMDDGDPVKILTFLHGPLESYYVCINLSTYEVFPASFVELALTFHKGDIDDWLEF